MPATPHCVADTLDTLDHLAGHGKAVSVGSIVDAFGARSYGPLIMLPALVELTPIGSIPGVPTFLAVTIMLVAFQKMIGRPRPWLPRLITDRSVPAARLANASARLRPVAEWMDGVFQRRLKFMTRAPFSQIAAAMVIVLCLTVPLLEVLPFASSVPMVTIAAFGLAVLVRDGVAMIGALALSLGALGMGLDLWDGGMSDTRQVDGLVDQAMVDSAQDSAEQAQAAVSEAGEDVQQAADELGEDVRDTAEDVGDQAADAIQPE